MGVMNTYYLKKFRKEAKIVIRARYNPVTLDTKYPYDCTESWRCINDSISKDLFELQQKLSEYRRNYILRLTRAEREIRIKKQLAKL